MPEAFLLQYRGAPRICLHAPIMLSFEEAAAVMDDLRRVLERASDPVAPPLAEGDVWPEPPPRPPRTVRTASRSPATLEDLA